MNRIYLLVLICVLPFCICDEYCRALALAGGGTKGSYQAGAIYGLVDNLPLESVAYDVVTGVSVGAVNALGVSLFSKGEEQAMIDYMYDVWYNFGKDDFMKNWKYGIANGILNKPGLFDNSLELEFIRRTMKPFPEGLKRKLTVGVVDANQGEYLALDLDEFPYDDKISKYVQASTAIPVIFPYMNDGARTWIDGGVIAGLDAISAVLRCKELVQDESKIIVDVIILDEIKLNKKDLSNAMSLEMLFRYFHLSSNMKEAYFLYDAMIAYPDVEWRYIISPTRKFPGINDIVPLDFDHDHLMEMFQMGQEDSLDIIISNSNRNEVLEKLKESFSYKPNFQNYDNLVKE